MRHVLRQHDGIHVDLLTEFDRKQFGAVVMEYLARKVETSLRQREHIDPARILDLQFNDFIADGVGTARRIYQHFHLPMSAEVEQRLQSYADASDGQTRQNTITA